MFSAILETSCCSQDILLKVFRICENSNVKAVRLFSLFVSMETSADFNMTSHLTGSDRLENLNRE